MVRLHWGRLILGGLVWWVTFHLIGVGLWYLFMRDQWLHELANLGRPLDTTMPIFTILYLALTLVAGFVALWLYAAILPLYGSGPGTVMRAAMALWLVGRFLPTVGWTFVLGFPGEVVAADLVTSLVAIVAATFAGAALYKKDYAPASTAAPS